MKKGHTKMNQSLNIDTKSQLAKLIATENVTVQHNNVKTASFDTQQRVLTLPIFKVKSGDVSDMLIAHECAHALWTPKKAWAKLSDPGFRAYVNVLEDCRIDAKIKKKYPKIIGEIRGIGLMKGLKMLVNNDEFIKKLIDQKMLTIKASENVIRLFPPLIVSNNELDEATNKIEKVCEEMS